MKLRQFYYFYLYIYLKPHVHCKKIFPKRSHTQYSSVWFIQNIENMYQISFAFENEEKEKSNSI